MRRSRSVVVLVTVLVALAACGPGRTTGNSSSRMEVIEIHECVPGDIKLTDGSCMTPVNPGSAETGGGNGTPPRGEPPGGGGGGGDRPPPPPRPSECQRCINRWVNSKSTECQAKATREECSSCVENARRDSACTGCLSRNQCGSQFESACEIAGGTAVCSNVITQACSDCVRNFGTATGPCTRLLRGPRRPRERKADCQRCYQASFDLYSECVDANQCRDTTGAPPSIPPSVDDVCTEEAPDPRDPRHRPGDDRTDHP